MSECECAGRYEPITRWALALAADHDHLAPPHPGGLDLRPPDANGTLQADPGRWKAVGTTVTMERTVAVGPLHVPGDGDRPVVGQLTRDGSRSRQALDAGLVNLRMRAAPLEQQEPHTESSDRKNNEASAVAHHGARAHNSPSPKGSAAIARDPAPNATAIWVHTYAHAAMPLTGPECASFHRLRGTGQGGYKLRDPLHMSLCRV